MVLLVWCHHQLLGIIHNVVVDMLQVVLLLTERKTISILKIEGKKS
jgi:hypothetical protein